MSKRSTSPVVDSEKVNEGSHFGLMRHYRILMLLCYLAGIMWFLALSSDDLNNKTYFSENALLPGLVNRGFTSSSALTRTLQTLKEEARRHVSMPYAWIQAQFRQAGLDVYVHNFTLNYPFGSKPSYKGNNIYAILRAPKIPGTEAMVVSTPYRGEDSIHESTLPTIALMIELAKYCRQFSYWSKDIIFLIAEYENIGFQAWLNAYHDVPLSSFLDSGSLLSRSGPIQGVVNLEITSEKFVHVDIKVEGLNGQLPNLDLFNLAIELCAREMVPATFHAQAGEAHNVNNFERLMTMVSMMAMQSTGLPNGAHGLFHRFGIQALTISSGKKHDYIFARVSLVNFGKVLEGILRGVNNLLERFHQSFFFYLLPSTHEYVSIGLYMPPFTLLALPVLIRAAYLYFQTRLTISEKRHFTSTKRFLIWYALDVIILSHSFGFLLYVSPNFVNIIQAYVQFSSEETLYYLICVLSCIFLVTSFIFSRARNLSQHMCYVKLCIVLLELGSFLYTLSLVNISMATVLSLMFVPFSVMIGCSGKFGILLSFLLLSLHPFVFTFLGVLMHSCISLDTNVWYHHLWYAFQGHKKIILYTIEDMYFYQNWNYKIVSFALVPIWHALWTLSLNRH